MIRIVTICLLISIVRSQECSLTEGEIETVETALAYVKQYIEKQDVNQNAIICLGNARAGKSTLINYLMGNKLKAVKLSRVSKITIEKADKTTAGPEIGSGSRSKTKIPSGWKSTYIPNAVIWDSPGFGDNRGPVTDITNTFSLYELFKNVDAMKIVIVADLQDIMGDNIQLFISLLNNLKNVVGKSFKNIFSSTALIFTKALYTDDGIKVDTEYVTNIFKDEILNNTQLDISRSIRRFISYMIDHSNHIAFFRRAKKTGDITSDLEDNIFQAINSSTFISRNLSQHLTPSISQSSKLCLFLTRNKLLTAPKFNALERAVTDVFTEQIKIIKSMNNDDSSSRLNVILNNLTAMKTKLKDFEKSNFSAYEGIELLGTIDVTVKNKIQNDGVLKTVQLIRFVNTLLQDRKNRELDLMVKSIFNAVLIKIEEAIAVILLKTHQISKEVFTQKMNLMNETAQKLIQNMTYTLEIERNKTKENQINVDTLDNESNGIQDGNKNSVNRTDALKIERTDREDKQFNVDTLDNMSNGIQHGNKNSVNRTDALKIKGTESEDNNFDDFFNRMVLNNT